MLSSLRELHQLESATMKSSVVSYSFRLGPGADLRESLLQFAQKYQLQAATIVCAVGSLTKAHMRLSNHQQGTVFEGPFEIVAMTGTLSSTGIHMHLSISDGEGKTLGGHLLSGCLVHTTFEGVLLESEQLIYCRKVDPQTGYLELQIQARS